VLGPGPAGACPFRVHRPIPPAAVAVLALLLAWGAAPRPATAYSVLAHEALVDSAWDDAIAPTLRQRFPSASAEQIAKARAFAYGGSVIQDLGYYPFGSHFFTDLLHYVRSGDFLEALITNARDVDEYAFALGALAHYSADITGHTVAVNRSVPLVYPKLRAKFGDEVTYNDDPKRHIMVEFAFDVVHVAGNGYVPDTYKNFVGFEVAEPLLDRAFRATYGLALRDVFTDVDLAIGTYRFAVSKLIPDVTRLAWREKQDEILKLRPDAKQQAFVYTLTQQEYEREYGTKYQKPGFLARFIVFMVKVLPKVGPLSVLAFRLPTPEAERLFIESFLEVRQRYGRLLDLARRNVLHLQNTDFDTGRPTARGEYPRADEAYTELRDKLAKKLPMDVPIAMRRDLTRFFGPEAPAGSR
jgi:zinc dependent phospholipase C